MCGPAAAPKPLSLLQRVGDALIGFGLGRMDGRIGNTIFQGRLPLEVRPMNLAQRLANAMGFHPILLIAHARGKSPSFTKKGPGRKHRAGKPTRRLQRATGPGSYAEADRWMTNTLYFGS